MEQITTGSRYKIRLEDDTGGEFLYNVTLRPQTSGVKDIYDVRQLLESRGTSFQQLAKVVAEWSELNDDVVLATLTFTGVSFRIGVLVDSKSEDRFNDLEWSLGDVRRRLKAIGSRPKIVLLGTSSRDSLLFTSIDKLDLFVR